MRHLGDCLWNGLSNAVRDLATAVSVAMAWIFCGDGDLATAVLGIYPLSLISYGVDGGVWGVITPHLLKKFLAKKRAERSGAFFYFLFLIVF